MAKLPQAQRSVFEGSGSRYDNLGKWQTDPHGMRQKYEERKAQEQQ